MLVVGAMALASLCAVSRATVINIIDFGAKSDDESVAATNTVSISRALAR